MEKKPVPNPETLENAREVLLEYTNELNGAIETAESLRGEIAEKDKTIEELRTLNQKFFLRLSQGEKEQEPEDEPRESLEDFAKKLKGRF